MKGIYLPQPRWTIVIESAYEWEDNEFSSNERFDMTLDILWAFRFRETSAVSVFDNRTNQRVARYEHERDALAFFKKHWPNCSDFVWRDRHAPTTALYPEANAEVVEDLGCVLCDSF